MDCRRNKRWIWLVPVLAALALIGSAPVAGTAPLNNALRCASEVQAGENTAPLSPLARARRDCPVLGGILEKYAAIDLGEAFPDDAKVAPSPDLVLATRFAASGDIPAMARHARLAREAGTTPAEIRELLYLTAVSAGLPKAMEATRALAEVLIPGTTLSMSHEACLRQGGKTPVLEN